jgi:tetratricopeptide (TPR) repeat protein
MGRYLLALNQPKKAYPYLKEAVALDFKNADYHFWLGVCYHGLNNLTKERESYHRAIAHNKRHIQAHLYLGKRIFIWVTAILSTISGTRP